ncbi:hypothetical protein PRIPAC_92058 [Pristionchus pacificus]|uniref:Uncharacterized protein n=1 Tax=Pristionchus pacificus TaxID=54126 RepID=A0A2A6B473_PRIPA|nr:hypothetical protein PRIPAC_92058 [Pristionchus pacificus]|eukprot:PDM60679.1 hypothetical protein PRIPAC_53948 [Pristionchus pacificus]
MPSIFICVLSSEEHLLLLGFLNQSINKWSCLYSMPFIAVSFANHDHSNVLHEKAQSTLSHVDKEISVISRLLFIHPLSQSRKKIYSICQWTQRIYFILLTSLLISAFIFLVFHQSPIFLLVFLSSLIDFCLLVWWNQSSVHDRFPVCLMDATSGVGSVKRRKNIETTQKFTFNFLLVISIFYIFVFVLSSLLLSNSSYDRLNSILSICLETIGLSVVISSTVAATTLFTTRLSLVSSEFHTHSDDFLTDGNTFQTCVSKHYTLIHSKIINVFSKVRHAFSLWISVHILIDFINFHFFIKNLLPLLHSTRPLPQDPVHLLLSISRDLFLPLFIPLTRIILSFSSVHRLQIASRRFIHHLVSLLCTENKMMNDQTYFVCITYISHLQSSSHHNLRLFGLILSSDFLLKISLCSLALLYFTHFRLL